ncbi:ABC transporter permease subunit [Antrihabitans stalactiti]|uniref:ABC transporter permease n=1 Tax=Antrihabitans stalactiti TaxID=2584121 RepID=A0A848KMB7_9NOCA|nr:ABC transporter permease subunit [Antrihabitans stalactiti]NMN99078.1 ABC transporter permease [Antrihabitans stalactiti]
MLSELTRIDLRLRRRSMIGYTVGMAVYAFVIVALYPTFKSDSGLDKFSEGNSTVAALFGASGSLTTSSGWLNANLYANFVPLVVLLLAIGYGASSVAGQNEDGTLGTVIALPISRRRVVAQKIVALCLTTVPVAAITAVFVAVGRAFDLSVDTAHLVGITLGVLLLGVDFGALAMLIGAATASRGTALGVSSSVAAASYLISSLAPAVHWIEPARYGSLFFYAVGDGQLVNGLKVPAFVVLVSVTVVLVAATVVVFERLDVR